MTFTAVRFLHKLKFVHRDISTGNFLLCNGKVKIMDLEYIKDLRTSFSSGEEMRTVGGCVSRAD